MSTTTLCDNCGHTSNIDWSSCGMKPGRYWRQVKLDDEDIVDFCSDECEKEYLDAMEQ